MAIIPLNDPLEFKSIGALIAFHNPFVTVMFFWRVISCSQSSTFSIVDSLEKIRISFPRMISEH